MIASDPVRNETLPLSAEVKLLDHVRVELLDYESRGCADDVDQVAARIVARMPRNVIHLERSEVARVITQCEARMRTVISAEESIEITSRNADNLTQIECGARATMHALRALLAGI